MADMPAYNIVFYASCCGDMIMRPGTTFTFWTKCSQPRLFVQGRRRLHLHPPAPDGALRNARSRSSKSVSKATLGIGPQARIREPWSAANLKAVRKTNGHRWRIGRYAASAAKREMRVGASGRPVNQAVTRSRLRAAAVATCCRRVLARPR